MHFGTPYVFSKFDVYSTAIILDTDWKDIAKVQAFQLSSIPDRNIVERAAVKKLLGLNIYHMRDNVVYFSVPWFVNHKSLFLALLYLSRDRNEDEIHNVIMPVLNQYDQAMKNLDGQAANVSRLVADMSNQFTKLSLKFPVFDIIKFTKACKKIGGQFVPAGTDTEPLYGFKLPKVISGNSVEGHVKYKSITTFFNSSLGIKKFIYEFNKVIYDSSWQIPGVFDLHPHTHTGTGGFCWGNRLGDYKLYKKAHSYEFMLALVKESLNSYNPESPYISIRKLASLIGVIEKRAEGLQAGDPTLQYPLELSPEQLARIYCRNCSDPLVDIDGRDSCTNPRCYSNPNAIVECESCHRPLESGNLNEDTGVYQFICRTTSCRRSPDFEPILVDKPYCVQCGGYDLRINSRGKKYCNHGRCESTNQWESSNTKWLFVGGYYRTREDARAYYYTKFGHNRPEFSLELLEKLKCPICSENLTIVEERVIIATPNDDRLYAYKTTCMNAHTNDFGQYIQCMGNLERSSMGYLNENLTMYYIPDIPDVLLNFYKLSNELDNLQSELYQNGMVDLSCQECDSHGNDDDDYNCHILGHSTAKYSYTNRCDRRVDWQEIQERVLHSSELDHQDVKRLKELIDELLALQNNGEKWSNITVLRGQFKELNSRQFKTIKLQEVTNG